MTGQNLPPFGKDIENDVRFQLGALAADLVSDKTKTSGDVHKVLRRFLANNPVGKRIDALDATEAASLRWQAIAGENQDIIERLHRERDEIYKEWCGRNFMHLPLPEALRQALKGRVDMNNLEVVDAFVKRVNARAEAEILKTQNIAGAHHRAIEAELKAMRPDAPSAPPT